MNTLILDALSCLKKLPVFGTEKINSLLGINPFEEYSLMSCNLSSITSSSNWSNDIVGFEEYPFNPDIISLYIAEANTE